MLCCIAYSQEYINIILATDPNSTMETLLEQFLYGTTFIQETHMSDSQFVLPQTYPAFSCQADIKQFI
jgi:hypothetical protein